MTAQTFRERDRADKRAYLSEVLLACNWCVVKAARVAAVSRPHFYKLLRRYGLKPRPVKGRHPRFAYARQIARFGVQ